MENNKNDINEIYIKLIEYINFIIKLIDDMCDYIYKGEGDKIFDNLNEFINGVDFILAKSSYIKKEIDLKKIDSIFINMEKAISIKEYVSFTDILIYELKPMLKDWIKILENQCEN